MTKPITTVSISEQTRNTIDALIQQGHYKTKKEVVEYAVRCLNDNIQMNLGTIEREPTFYNLSEAELNTLVDDIDVFIQKHLEENNEQEPKISS
jgi:Arc/MetJ-type ribon-helix-helix transcriptional regulator